MRSRSNEENAPPRINDQQPRKKLNTKELALHQGSEEKKIGADDVADLNDTVRNYFHDLLSVSYLNLIIASNITININFYREITNFKPTTSNRK